MDKKTVQLKSREFRTPKKHMDELHYLTKTCVKLCEQHGIFLMAMSGTLLGIVRDNEYIPWDDDVDLAVNFVDYGKLMGLNPLLKKKNMELSDQGYPWKKGKPWNIIKFKYLGREMPFIDLFPFIYDGFEYRMPPLGKVPAAWYRRNLYRLAELYPLTQQKLKDADVTCPNDPRAFIHRSYGPDAVERCVITHQHLHSGALVHLERRIASFLGQGLLGKKFDCRWVDHRSPGEDEGGDAVPLKWVFFLSVWLIVFLIFLTSAIVCIAVFR